MEFLETFFNYLRIIDDFYWSYIGFTIVTTMGIYFTFKTNYFQFKILMNPKKNLLEMRSDANHNDHGTHPFKLYFASIGGMIGLGNLVGVVTVTTIGGPGGVFWMWIAAFAGMLIKYAEIYLGVTYRVRNEKNGYDGGPMYYLHAAFGNKFLPYFVSILLCIYGAEVYQFNILVNTLTNSFTANKYIVVAILLITVIYSAIGGVHRFAHICTAVMPFFLLLYLVMCVWVIGKNFEQFLAIIPVIFKSAFTGHAAVGGFAGASMIIAAQYGTARAVYSGDIGIGYDSIIQSETKIKAPEKQARVAIYALLSSTIICSLTSFIILVTDFWKLETKLPASEYVGKILANYFPHMDIFIVILITLAAITTIIGYLVIGLKCAKYLNSKYGEKVYICYAVFSLSFFAFADQSEVILIMSVSGGLLMLCNLLGIIKLHNKIKFI